MIDWIMWFLLGGIMFTSGLYLIYWLIIEMPVLVKIKHEELYDYWKYPNARGTDSKPNLWGKK